MIERVFAFIARMLLSLRYRVTISGAECLWGNEAVLLLPNHPAEIDPVILAANAWKYRPVRPVVLEKYYFLPWIHHILKFVKSIPMPDMDIEPGPFKRRRVERAMNSTARALKDGQSVLLYPAGRVKVSGMERIGGNSGVYSLVQQRPGVKIVLVRTMGLYGSIFSKALTGGESPDFLRMLVEGVRIVLMNFVFLVPKRDVYMEFEEAPADFPRSGGPMVVNRWLEKWYNRDGPEPVTLVSRKFWKEDVPQVPSQTREVVDLSDVDPEVIEAVTEKIAVISGVPREKVKPESRLGDDLGLDSLAAADLLLWLNEKFDARDVEMTEMASVSSIVAAASGKLSGVVDTYEVPRRWFEDFASREDPLCVTANSLHEAFLMTAKRMKSSVAMGDERSGILEWNRVLIAVLLLADQIRKLEGQHVGILLPASVGASLLTMATMFAGKVPVMLNWTAGRRNVEHALSVCEVRSVLTSAAFLDIVETDLEYIESKLVYIEDLRKRIGLAQKISGLILSRLSVSAILRHLGLENLSKEDAAVVLFTSGSEADPKGVPLSHKNILSNIAASLDLLKFVKDDVLYGFLPPFHSFGLTVCVFVPLVSGLKVVYHPNPNESRKIALGCSKWRVSGMAGTPTFLKAILKSSEPGQLDSLRVFISGAEKAPDDLFEIASKLVHHAEIVEGYGITECSPIVCGNRLGEPHAGVGKPLKGVELLIVHHETMEPLPQGERGLILVRGDNVFSGYLGGRANPFVQVQGKPWYNSGDLGYLDENGALHISGRLKRFVKIGGEMISLAAVEEVLSEKWPATEEGPALAVTAVEQDDKRPRIHVFMKYPVEVERLNDLLSEAGFSNLMKISEVHGVPEIPLLGTGKTDFQALNRLLRSKA